MRFAHSESDPCEVRTAGKCVNWFQYLKYAFHPFPIDANQWRKQKYKRLTWIIICTAYNKSNQSTNGFYWNMKRLHNFIFNYRAMLKWVEKTRWKSIRWEKSALLVALRTLTASVNFIYFKNALALIQMPAFGLAAVIIDRMCLISCIVTFSELAFNPTGNLYCQRWTSHLDYSGHVQSDIMKTKSDGKNHPAEIKLNCSSLESREFFFVCKDVIVIMRKWVENHVNTTWIKRKDV